MPRTGTTIVLGVLVLFAVLDLLSESQLEDRVRILEAKVAALSAQGAQGASGTKR